ncbi:MAG: molybdopterin guanine dinucleotide synthesis [Nitrospinae bacterium]|nr:molybdopterin guanine dinucleotide synthesis [Nitrospinota bacterium]
MTIFHTHVIVDWSARSTPSPARPTKDTIWWAVARGGIVDEPAYARTRHDAVERLTSLVAAELDAARHVLIGFDFPFGYPAGVATHLAGEASALALWDWLAARIEDAEDNANTRFEVAEAINRTYPGMGPFWGRPESWQYPEVPTRKSSRTSREAHPNERRIADHHAKGAKTVWQLAYAGSVGSQVLLGLPAIKRLIEHPRMEGRLAVWPFETGLRAPEAHAVVAEIYPSLLRREIEERKNEGEIPDAAQVRVNAEAFARLDALGGLVPLFEGAPFLNTEERRIIETEEAWILGLGHEEALREVLGQSL